MSIFVTAAAGTEKALKAELRELRLRGIKGDRGGVHVGETADDAMARICLGSRVGVRVLKEVASFDCPDEDALYEGVGEIEWERWLSPERTLAVTAVSKHEGIRHTGYIAQRTKDAVVDRQRRRQGARSSVDRRDPDVAIFVHLAKGRAAVFLDGSGRSLHLRGWREEAGEAPLKETLAAAIVRLCGWDRAMPLVDPMCGSGTIPIEADQLARAVPPQRRDRRFGFERWLDHDEAAARQLVEVRERFEAGTAADGPPCLGSDSDGAVIEIARRNATRAGSRASFSVGALSALALETPSHVVTNPPYGARLSAEPRQWRELGEALARLEGHRVSVLLPDDAPGNVFPRHARHHRLFNGSIPCRLVSWGPPSGR